LKIVRPSVVAVLVTVSNPETPQNALSTFIADSHPVGLDDHGDSPLRDHSLRLVGVTATAREVLASVGLATVQIVLVRVVSRDSRTGKHDSLTLRVSELPHVGDVAAQDRRVRANLNLRE